MNLIHKDRLFSTIFLVSFIAIVLVSCTTGIPDDYHFTEIPSSLSKRLDSIDVEIWRQYAVNPDSAEKILYWKLRLLDSLNIPQKLVYTHLDLCELYQYRKPDYFKALENLGCAVRLFVEYPGPYSTNPYMFTDIGNLFFKFRFYKEAIAFYRISFDIGKKYDMWHARALAMQNIALSWTALDNTDSAIFFISEADRNIPDRTDLMLAKNNMYLADIQLKKGSFEDLNILISNSFTILLNYRKNRPEMAEGKNDRIFLSWCEIMAKLHNSLSVYFQLRNDPVNASIQLDSAIKYARRAESVQLIGNLYFRRVLHQGKHESDLHIISDIDSAYFYINKINDLVLHKSFSDSMVIVSHQRNLKAMEQKFSGISKLNSDSLIRQQASYGLISNIMHMATVATTQSLQQLQLKEAARSNTIRYQRWAIFSFLALTMIIIVFLLLILRQKGNLNKAYIAMVGQIQSSIRHHDEFKDKKSLKTNMPDFPVGQLDLLMRREKPFLNKDLTLADVADLLSTNQTYLSAYLNNHLNIDFSSYINEFRVKEACILLMKPDMQHLTVDTLAGMAGFNTKSTFYTAFRKFTGMTPAAYQKAGRSTN